MKKLILFAILVVSVVSCEREDEKVEGNTPINSKLFNKTIENEKNSSKTASDTVFVKNISPDAGLEDPIDEVDPKDITPPRR